ncbi:GAS2-like protein 2 [Lethenteron reissneri]|uniref:GAS2-like protein 2 n=1 Tax=Lethenteron reissneri TaxID=7753 RepID=UPI002AB71E50|nr:GAS2-like protein 2 [Lethenteron reissneri]
MAEVDISSAATKSIRPFRSSEEYLYAMKEDLAEWLSALHSIDITVDNFLEELETGTVLCHHANTVNRQAAEFAEAQPQAAATMQLPQGDLAFASRDVKTRSFQARDNVSNFIGWCRHRLGVNESVMFESNDLVLRRNEKHFVLCLLEVARRGARFGMLAPVLVQLEREIDEEIRLERQPEAQPPPPAAAQPQRKTCDLKSLDGMVRFLLSRCTCPVQFPMVRVSEGKYRVGDSSSLIYVRILRKHVMVRVGGGWDTLEHYLDKHDPCRCLAPTHRTPVKAGGSSQLSKTATSVCPEQTGLGPRSGSQLRLSATTHDLRPYSPLPGTAEHRGQGREGTIPRPGTPVRMRDDDIGGKSKERRRPLSTHDPFVGAQASRPRTPSLLEQQQEQQQQTAKFRPTRPRSEVEPTPLHSRPYSSAESLTGARHDNEQVLLRVRRSKDGRHAVTRVALVEVAPSARRRRLEEPLEDEASGASGAQLGSQLKESMSTSLPARASPRQRGAAADGIRQLVTQPATAVNKYLPCAPSMDRARSPAPARSLAVSGTNSIKSSRSLDTQLDVVSYRAHPNRRSDPVQRDGAWSPQATAQLVYIDEHGKELEQDDDDDVDEEDASVACRPPGDRPREEEAELYRRLEEEFRANMRKNKLDATAEGGGFDNEMNDSGVAPSLSGSTPAASPHRDFSDIAKSDSAYSSLLSLETMHPKHGGLPNGAQPRDRANKTPPESVRDEFASPHHVGPPSSRGGGSSSSHPALRHLGASLDIGGTRTSGARTIGPSSCGASDDSGTEPVGARISVSVPVAQGDYGAVVAELKQSSVHLKRVDMDGWGSKAPALGALRRDGTFTRMSKSVDEVRAVDPQPAVEAVERASKNGHRDTLTKRLILGERFSVIEDSLRSKLAKAPPINGSDGAVNGEWRSSESSHGGDSDKMSEVADGSEVSATPRVADDRLQNDGVNGETLGLRNSMVAAAAAEPLACGEERASRRTQQQQARQGLSRPRKSLRKPERVPSIYKLKLRPKIRPRRDHRPEQRPSKIPTPTVYKQAEAGDKETPSSGSPDPPSSPNKLGSRSLPTPRPQHATSPPQNLRSSLNLQNGGGWQWQRSRPSCLRGISTQGDQWDGASLGRQPGASEARRAPIRRGPSGPCPVHAGHGKEAGSNCPRSLQPLLWAAREPAAAGQRRVSAGPGPERQDDVSDAVGKTAGA